MNVNEITTIITTVGFPIVMCGAMAYYVKYISDKNRKEIHELNAQHREETSELTTAIDNNTQALTKLCERLERG